MPRVNWRRGFNRAVLALTLVWMCYALAILSNGERSSRHSKYLTLRDELIESRLTLQKLEASAKAVDDSGHPVLGDSVQDQVLADLLALRRREVAAGEERLRAADDARKENPFVTIFTPPRLQNTLTVLFIPPIASYALLSLIFSLLAWIIRGFKTEPPAPPAAENPPT